MQYNSFWARGFWKIMAIDRPNHSFKALPTPQIYDARWRPSLSHVACAAFACCHFCRQYQPQYRVGAPIRACGGSSSESLYCALPWAGISINRIPATRWATARRSSAGKGVPSQFQAAVSTLTPRRYTTGDCGPEIRVPNRPRFGSPLPGQG